MSEPLRVLVIDDSAVVRQVVTALLEASGGFEVRVAADPLIARERIRAHRPDVLLLDLEMPRMDGLTFLAECMESAPIPTVVCSSLGARGTQEAMRALELGALAVLEKPRVGARAFLEESALALTQALREAAQVTVRPRRRPLPSPDAAPPPPRAMARPPPSSPAGAVIALGASTGGTEAILEVLRGLDGASPGVVVVQHMPEKFTEAFARRLDALCPLEVREAKDGDRLTAGVALIAPGNRHLTLRQLGPAYAVSVSHGLPVSGHRPSVDVLFRSVAQTAGPGAVAALLTGMGVDGAAGMRALNDAGARCLAQDEASSVVFGMPRAAIELGAVHRVLPLSRIAQAITEELRRPPRPQRHKESLCLPR